MPRVKRDRRTRRTDLRTLKAKGLTQEYWEEILRRDGLSMHAGRSDRVSFVGGTTELEVFVGVVKRGVRATGTSQQAD